MGGVCFSRSRSFHLTVNTIIDALSSSKANGITRLFPFVIMVDEHDVVPIHLKGNESKILNFYWQYSTG